MVWPKLLSKSEKINNQRFVDIVNAHYIIGKNGRLKLDKPLNKEEKEFMHFMVLPF
jgi:hypothetical protein